MEGDFLNLIRSIYKKSTGKGFMVKDNVLFSKIKNKARRSLLWLQPSIVLENGASVVTQRRNITEKKQKAYSLEKEKHPKYLCDH